MSKWMLPILLLAISAVFVGLLLLALTAFALPKSLVLFAMGLWVLVLAPMLLLCCQYSPEDDKNQHAVHLHKLPH